MEMTPVKSSNVVAVGYDDKTGEIVVQFNNGGTYSKTATRGTFEELLASPSKGKFVAQNLRNMTRR